MKRLIALSLVIFLSINAYPQSAIVKDFKPVCDSLSTLLKEKTSVTGYLKLKSIRKSGDKLDFYFDESLGDFPFRRGDVEWLRSTLKKLFPS